MLPTLSVALAHAHRSSKYAKKEGFKGAYNFQNVNLKSQPWTGRRRQRRGRPRHNGVGHPLASRSGLGFRRRSHGLLLLLLLLLLVHCKRDHHRVGLEAAGHVKMGEGKGVCIFILRGKKCALCWTGITGSLVTGSFLWFPKQLLACM